MQDSENWTDITESTKQTGPIGTLEFLVKEFGVWTLGYQWINVHLGPASTTGLALYAKHQEQPKHTYVVFSLKEAIGFFADHQVPPRWAGRLLAEATANGKWDR